MVTPDEPDEDQNVAEMAASLRRIREAHKEEREGKTFTIEQKPAAPALEVSPTVTTSRTRPEPYVPPQPEPTHNPRTPAPASAPLPSEDLVVTLLSELRQSRQERQALAQELAQVRQFMNSLAHQLSALQSTAPVPTWLIESAGDPRTYDAPDPARKPSGLRLHPAITKAIAIVQTRRGLRSRVGATEYLLRLGLAAEEKIPSKR